MIPRDWVLVSDGYRAANTNRPAGADAPSDAEVADLVAKYG